MTATGDPVPAVLRATGFWRLAAPAESGGVRTWLVDPDGRPTFLLGVNTVLRNTLHLTTPRCAGISAYFRRHADPRITARVEWARLSGAGHDPKPYHFNSVGAFSEENDLDASGPDSYMVRRPPDGAGAPYAVVLDVAPRGGDGALADGHGNLLQGGFSRSRMGDPFDPRYLDELGTLADKVVKPRKDDPGLQMWFAGNELGIFDVAGHRQPGAPEAGVRDLRHWIWAPGPQGSTVDQPQCARHALAAFLRQRYTTVDALNGQWHSRFNSWDAVVGEPPFGAGYSPVCGEDLQRFVHTRLLPAWVRAIAATMRAADPHHLIASPRLAIATPPDYRFWRSESPGPEHWADPPHATLPADSGEVRFCPFDALGGDGGFDLVAINAYCGQPTFPDPWFSAGLAKLHQLSGLPLVISEFGIRARIKSWKNNGGAPSFVPETDRAAAQRERGRRYATQIEQFAGHSFLVGACWHAWSDRYNADEDQINMGLVQCTDPAEEMVAGQRWEPAHAPIAQANREILRTIHARTGF